jgi:hypothetical protein
MGKSIAYIYITDIYSRGLLVVEYEGYGTFVDWHGVRHSISRVQNTAGGSSGSV